MNDIKITVDQLKKEIQCLSCENVMDDFMLLRCGHIICNPCISTYSMINDKSAVKCDPCMFEMKVVDLSYS